MYDQYLDNVKRKKGEAVTVDDNDRDKIIVAGYIRSGKNIQCSS